MPARTPRSKDPQLAPVKTVYSTTYASKKSYTKRPKSGNGRKRTILATYSYKKSASKETVSAFKQTSEVMVLMLSFLELDELFAV